MTAQTSPFFVPQALEIQFIFGPKYLNLPGISGNLHLVVLSAVFYQLIYSFIGPLLFLYVGPPDLKGRPAKLSAYFFSITLVSLSQSFFNSALAVYLLYHTEFRAGLTPQERYLGYHEKTASALSLSTGYFCFHLVETWFSRAVWGYSMFLHGVCALFAVSLGFRPMGLHYTAIFLIWELPNLFLNLQRQLDRYGKRQTLIRKVNRLLTLSTYTILRLGLGTYSIACMASDLLKTFRDSDPVLGMTHITPSNRVLSGGKLQSVQLPPLYLALFQLGSMTFLSAQGYWWFGKILVKGDF